MLITTRYGTRVSRVGLESGVIVIQVERNVQYDAGKIFLVTISLPVVCVRVINTVDPMENGDVDAIMTRFPWVSPSCDSS